MTNRTLRTVVVLLGLALLPACSPSATDRRDISGAVTWDGQPVPAGTIYFETDVSKGNNGPQAVGDIKDGRYRTKPEFGAVLGPHTVRVVILPGAGDDPGNPRPKKTGIRPGEYTTTVDIQASTPQVDFALPFKK